MGVQFSLLKDTHVNFDVEGLIDTLARMGCPVKYLISTIAQSSNGLNFISHI
jgi:hypothetical protein